MRNMLLIAMLFLPTMAFSAGEPVVNEVKVYFEGQQTTETNFHVGDSISLEIDATDPDSRPLEYVFRVYRSCIYAQDIQSWSSSNQVNYTFSNEDIGGCFSIITGVKNNDSSDTDGFFGDIQSSIRLNISSQNQKRRREY